MYGLLDIGGTKTRIAVSEDLNDFGEVRIIPTSPQFDEGISNIVQALTELAHGKPLAAVAAGIAASPNKDRTELIAGGSNIRKWLREPITEKLSDALGCPAYIENDTAMGGLAQVTFGPAQGRAIAAYITVSTGVGGCRFVNGMIDQSTSGFEPGWQIIDASHIADTSELCGGGFLESFIGGACMEQHEGHKPAEIVDKTFWEEKAKWLAYGLHNICALWSPEVIVVGGSMMNAVGIPLPEVRMHLEDTLRGMIPMVPEIVPAAFGDQMGLNGAMAYLKQREI